MSHPANQGTEELEAARHEWFEARIEALLPRLMGTALRLAGDQADAEDLVAECLMKGWSRLDSLEDDDALGAWLCRILTNVFISQRRSSAARADIQAYTEESPDTEESFSLFERLHQPFLLWQSNPEREFLNRLLRDDLSAAIDALPDVFRVVVVLVDVQGCSYQEVAESLEVPVGTVRSRLSRGRALLQEALWTQAVDAGLKEAETSKSEDPPRPDTRGTHDE